MIRLCGSGLVRHGVKLSLVSRALQSSDKLLFPLNYHPSVLSKVYLWVYKVTIFLYKTLRIALETQVDSVCSTRLALTCVRRLEWLSVLSGNCRWHHAGRKLHLSCHRPSGWGNSVL